MNIIFWGTTVNFVHTIGHVRCFKSMARVKSESKLLLSESKSSRKLFISDVSQTRVESLIHRRRSVGDGETGRVPPHFSERGGKHKKCPPYF